MYKLGVESGNLDNGCVCVLVALSTVHHVHGYVLVQLGHHEGVCRQEGGKEGEGKATVGVWNTTLYTTPNKYRNYP